MLQKPYENVNQSQKTKALQEHHKNIQMDKANCRLLG